MVMRGKRVMNGERACEREAAAYSVAKGVRRREEPRERKRVATE